MDNIDITGLSTQHQLYILYATVGLKLAGEFISSVRQGGGLRRILMSFWSGENIPKPIADDYKHELSKPPFQK